MVFESVPDSVCSLLAVMNVVGKLLGDLTLKCSARRKILISRFLDDRSPLMSSCVCQSRQKGKTKIQRSNAHVAHSDRTCLSSSVHDLILLRTASCQALWLRFRIHIRVSFTHGTGLCSTKICSSHLQVHRSRIPSREQGHERTAMPRYYGWLAGKLFKTSTTPKASPTDSWISHTSRPHHHRPTRRLNRRRNIGTRSLCVLMRSETPSRWLPGKSRGRDKRS